MNVLPMIYVRAIMHATGEKLGVLNTLDDLILASVQTFITSLTSSCMLHFIVAYI